MKVLANDGISRSGVELLEKNGFDVELTKVAPVSYTHLPLTPLLLV